LAGFDGLRFFCAGFCVKNALSRYNTKKITTFINKFAQNVCSQGIFGKLKTLAQKNASKGLAQKQSHRAKNRNKQRNKITL